MTRCCTRLCPLTQNEVQRCEAFTSHLFFIIRANGTESRKPSLTVGTSGVKGRKTICINKVRHFPAESGPEEDQTKSDLK